MKVFFLLTFVLSFGAWGNTWAQKVSVRAKDASFKSVIQQVQRQSGYSFIIKEEYFRNARKINLHVENTEVLELLPLLFNGQPFSYSVNGKMVSAVAFPNKSGETLSKEESQQAVRGRVTNEKGEPLTGVTVSEKGTSNSVITNINGDYNITLNKKEGTLRFSYVGYIVKEMPVTGSTLNLVLEADVNELADVVVVGYGTQRKKDVLSAISSVKANDLVINSGPEIGNMLKGKVPGLMIRQNSAQPGGGLDIRIRGAASIIASNDPLIVVDGFPISDLQQPGNGGRYQAGSQSVLNSFNPNDIESIEVLKDASATAIYGSRAANGVILITTKSGKEGKAQVQYSPNYTYQKFKNPFDVLPLNEWMEVRNEAGLEQWLYDNRVSPYGPRSLEQAQEAPVNKPFRPLYSQKAIDNVGTGTDWVSLVTRDGSTQQHNLSVSGGTAITNYLVSGNYFNQRGVVKNSGFERFSVRTNINQKINSFLKLGVNLTASQINNENTQLGGDQYENSGIIRAAMQQGPHIQAVDENGNYPVNPQLALQPNPYSLLTISDNGRVERLLLNSFLEISPFDGLKINLKAGVDRGGSKRENYLPKTTLHGALENGKASIASLSKDDFLIEGTANYNKIFAEKHHFTTLVGASRQKSTESAYNSGNTGFITDSFLWNNLNAGAGTKSVGSSKYGTTIASYFGRMIYNYDDRYHLSATLRTDGASVFARNNKWGTFPSLAFGWNLSEEHFMEHIQGFAPMLKLRVGYGKTGNASIGSNAFASYSASPVWLTGDEQILISVALDRLENPNLKWETTTEKNIGLDFSIFKGSVEGSLDLFDKVISDLLAVKNINSYHEVNTIVANIGKTQSKGFEVGITSHNIRNEKIHWRTMLSVSKYIDRWKERASDWKPAIYEKVNDPIRVRYLPLADGVQQLNDNIPDSQPEIIPGMVRLKDLDGFKRDENGNPMVDENGRFLRTGGPDGLLDAADFVSLGTTDPKLILGFTNIIDYKNWSLNFDFNGMLGRKMEDPNFVSYGVSAAGIYQNGYNGLRTVKNRWTPDNPSSTHPGTFWGYSPYGPGDLFLENAWFIRLQNIALSYRIPNKYFGKFFSDASISVSAHNLFVITPYKGIDPETDSYTAAYPNIQSFTMGLNFKF